MKTVPLCRSAYNRLTAVWCCLILLSFSIAGAQAQLLETKTEATEQVKGNYYQARAEFYKEWEKIQQRRREIDEVRKKEEAMGGQTSSTLEKMKGGFKSFKRWEWFWGMRVAPDGSFPSLEEYNKEWQKYLEQRKNSTIMRDMAGRTAKKQESPLNIWANWSHLGPFGAPTPTGSGGSGGAGIGRVTCVAFGGTEDTIFIGTPASGVWRTTNRGVNWGPMTTELPPHGVAAIAVDPRQNGRVFIGATRMSLLRASNGGDSRQGLGAYRSDDGGSTWTALTALILASDTTNDLDIRRLRIHPTGPDTIFAATNQGIFRSNDAGNTWFMVSGGNVADLEFHPANPSIIYATSFNDAGTNRARIWRSTTGGSANSFNAIMNNIPLSFGRIEIAVSANQSNWIYAMCSDQQIVGFGAMYRSTDTGSTWTAIVPQGSLSTLVGTQAFVNFALAVTPSNANTVCAGGLDFWRSDNGGGTNTWQKKTSWNSSGSDYLHADQWDIVYPPGSNGSVVYIGNDGGIHRSTNWGTNWTAVNGNLSTMTLYRLGIDQNHDKMTIVGAQDNGSSRYWPYVNGSWHPTWEKVYGGDGMESVVSPSNNNDKVYTMIQNGKLFISDNWGASYSEDTPDAQLDGQGNGRGAWVTPMMHSSGTYGCVLTAYDRVYAIKDEDPNVPEVGHRQISVVFPNSGELAIAMEVHGGSMYVATTELGASGAPDTFRLYRGTITTESYTPPMSAATYLYPKVSSWTLLSGGPAALPVTSIEGHPDDGDVIYVTCGQNGGVFKSVNKGRTWTNITGGLPNVTVNSIVFEDDNSKPHREGMYIGTDFGVYYRDNAMADWDVFDIGGGWGMGNSPVMELEIHKNKGLVRAATFGRGLYECELFEPSASTKYYPVAYGRNSDSFWIQKMKLLGGNGVQEQVTGDNNGYIDMTRSTTLNLAVYKGGAHILEITRGMAAGQSSSTAMKYRVWIDLNEDGTFDDANELVGTADNLAANAVQTVWLNIPTTYANYIGTTRMRIALGAGGSIPDHDSPFTTGEVEDYTVEVKDCINFGGVLSAYPVYSNEATITWSGSESSSYDLRYRVKNAANWTYAPAASIVTPYPGYNDIFACELTGLSASTYYEVQVRARCGIVNGGVSTAWSPTPTFLVRTIPSSAPYCPSFSVPMQGALSDCETYISNVKISQGLNTRMNHTSGNDFGYQKFGYSGYGMPVAELPVGYWFSVNLTAVEICPPDFNDLFRRWKIWIDLDHNNEFDADELIYDSNNSTTSLNQSGSMLVPVLGTTLGNTRMRVSMKGIGYQNTAANAAGPCDVLPYGEVQDYKIELYNPNIRGPIATGFSDGEEQGPSLQVSPNPATDEVHVEYNCASTGDAIVEIVDMFGRVVATVQQPCTEGVNSMTLPVQQLASGMYTLRITNSQKIVTQTFTVVR